ncbi:LuxR C-terminal-related transcriptional regulator [Promicromonospora vindobonensis]|uniref:LuxR C-terminal-related transcriptional regulator n=1 Tax=Promicromonospora vindobonensis TaxID=195748 RepID=A0ABW5VR41_9MICO
MVWVDVPESDQVDGDALGLLVHHRLLDVTAEEPQTAGIAEALTGESLAAALDAHGAVLVVDRLGPTSGEALVYLDRVARLLRRGRVVVLTAAPLPASVPTLDGRIPAGEAPKHLELLLHDLAVRPDEAQAAAAALGAPLSRSQARLLVTAAAGFAAVIYPVLEEVRRVHAGDVAVTDDIVSTIAAAHRAALLRAALPPEAIRVLVEASLGPRFSRTELASTGLLAELHGAPAFLDRLVDAGLVLDDPSVPDDVLAVEPNARRALLDYARGRGQDELHLRAAKAARRREQAGDTRGALLVGLESGDAELVRDLLQNGWTGVLDGHDPTLHEALWGAAAAVPVHHVPAELRALLSVTRRSPGRPGTHETSTTQLTGPQRPNGPEGHLPTFARIARLRRAGRTDDALRLARGLLGPARGGLDLEQVLVGLQAAVTAIEAGLLDEALRYAESVHQGALGSGALPLAAAAAELAALVHALDSGVHAAADWSAEVDALPEPPAWWRHAVGDPAALASALVRLERFNDDLPDDLLDAVQDAAQTELWFAGLHVEATLAALRRQEEPAVNQLRDTLARRGLTPSEAEPSTDHLQIPPLLALDLGRLYLGLGRGTIAVVIAGSLTGRTPAAALLDARLRLAQGLPHDALLATTAVGHQGSTAGARLETHLLAGEALTAITDGTTDDADVRRELAHATALAHQLGGALPFWWASSDILRRMAEDAPEPVRENIAQVLRRRGGPAPVEFVVVPDRQLVVLHRLADGLTSTEVAKASFVSHNTVKTQIREVYRRLGVHNRTAALRRARELGLLDPIVRARLRAGSPSSL